MSLTHAQKEAVIALLSGKIDSKLRRYERESSAMPFLVRLIQNHEHVAAYSFIHSMATTLGMSIYEEVAKITAAPSCTECFTKFDLGGVISKEQKSVIANILRELRNAEREVDIENESAEVLRADASAGKSQKEGRIADFYMLREGVEYFFEIKTVKPNIDVFAKSKEKLLEWVARRRKEVRVFLAFPYNPYHPEPYGRFTVQGMLKQDEDLLIAETFWDFLGGKGSYAEILDLFDAAGKTFKARIAAKIKEVAEAKMKT